MCQNKERVPAIWCSDKIVEAESDQPEMILTEEVLEQSPDVRLVAIHNHFKDGTDWAMNFELSNGYVTKQTSDTTAHRHVIPDAVFTHTASLEVHYLEFDWITGFMFLDA